ncbi:MAG: hypothetical protein ACI4F9_10285 [Lachnospiraceae bacterium]
MIGIDYIVKIGGSVLYSISKTKKVLNKLEETKERIAIYVGSGAIGEVVKRLVNSEGENIVFSKENGFLITSSIHKINALILCSLSDSFILCYNKEECISGIRNNYKPILDSEGFAQVLANEELLQTDFQAALLCKHFDVKKLVIVTDVNGVFPVDPKSDAEVEQIKNISTKELVDLGRTSVDLGTAKILDECSMECIVVGCDEVISIEEWNYDNVRAIGTVIRGEKIND